MISDRASSGMRCGSRSGHSARIKELDEVLRRHVKRPVRSWSGQPHSAPRKHAPRLRIPAPHLRLITLPFPFIVWGAEEIRRYRSPGPGLARRGNVHLDRRDFRVVARAIEPPRVRSDKDFNHPERARHISCSGEIARPRWQDGSSGSDGFTTVPGEPGSGIWAELAQFSIWSCLGHGAAWCRRSRT